MPISDNVLDLLICPKTGEPLQLAGQNLVNQDGSETYPVIGDIPWLLPNPQNSLMDWSVKLNHFNQVLVEEIQTLQRELKRASGATQKRLEVLLQGKQNFLQEVGELLTPMVKARSATKQVYDALKDKAPSTQNLLSYEANFYRDWVWGDEENTLAANLVAQHFLSLDCKKLLVLGAGSGRLACDIHEKVNPTLTIATDINPLLVLAAERVLKGNDLSLHEFPMHPKSSEFVAVSHTISAKKALDNFHFVFSDAIKPCFKNDFDVVLTPWFIDIQPLEFSRFLRQLNQYIPVGAHWVNFGSLVFNQKRDAHCYAIEEVKEVALQQGFKIEQIHEHEIPYLKSPYNAGHRVEHVWTWTAKKIEDVKPINNPQTLPTWILDEKQPIPKTQYFQQIAFTHRIYAELASEVDGKTPLAKIAKKMAKQNRMDEKESLQMLRDFFLQIYHQNQ